MNKKSSILSFFLSVIIWIFPVLSMIPNLFSGIAVYEKIIINLSILIMVTTIFILVWMSFFLARKNNIMKRILPNSNCNICTDIFCCLKVVRPGVNYKKDILNLESDNFIDEFELASLEARKPLKEVWIISPDLSYECKETFFTEVVRCNIKKGVKYRFITQDNADSRENEKKLYNKFTNILTRLLYKNRFKVYRSSAPEFDIVLSLYSIVVYNPNYHKNKYTNQIFICVGENEDDVHSIYKEINNEQQINLTLDTIRSIIESTKTRK